jgi:hypothetical protein
MMAHTVNPFDDNNPFEDHINSDSDITPTIVYSTAGAFSDIEVVRRPFIPTLPDELAVKPGDNVRVLHSFDDGWALVEMVGTGFSTMNQQGRGLIPIDCLREPGQELPAFIASKRVSSYGDSFVVY